MSSVFAPSLVPHHPFLFFGFQTPVFVWMTWETPQLAASPINTLVLTTSGLPPPQDDAECGVVGLPSATTFSAAAADHVGCLLCLHPRAAMRSPHLLAASPRMCFAALSRPPQAAELGGLSHDLIIDAVRAVAWLPGPRHPSARFAEFVAQRGLSLAERGALWRIIMLRPIECASNPPPGQSRRPCYCHVCAPWLQDALEGGACDKDKEDPPAHRHPLSCCYVYPSYEYQPPPPEKSEGVDIAQESAVHRYLVRMRRLPAPLPKDMLSRHTQLLAASLEVQPQPNVVECKGNVTRDAVLANIRKTARGSDVLLLVLCGHGLNKDGALVLSDGHTLALADVFDQLRRVDFKGHMLCVVNTCHAEPQPPSRPAEAGAHLALFPWVVLCSSDWDEGQKPSHADHVTRLVAALLNERPKYSDLEERISTLWVKTRDKDQKSKLWRGPPFFSAARSLARSCGCLLGDAPHAHSVHLLD